ncbi:MAG: nucleoside hydrolase [Planctomycetota bacterium]|nr:nucleoside hydrolase [Planctomycetota bacterium]
MPRPRPQALLLDTDPGLDDALALAVCSAGPEFNLVAACAVGGNVSLARTWTNLRGLLTLLGRGDCPCYRGREPRRGLHAPEVHGGDGLGGDAKRLPKPAPSGTPRNLSALLERLAAQPDRSVAWLCVGPLTNAAALLRADRALLRRKIGRLVVMGGALFDAGNVAPMIEFNTACDPGAAEAVLSSGLPQRWVPLDVTHRVTLTRQDARALKALGTPRSRALGRCVAALVEFQDRMGPAPAAGFDSTFPLNAANRPRGGCAFVHDALAAFAVARPGAFTWRTLPLRVVTRGEAAGMLLSDRRVSRRAARTGWPSVEVALEVDVRRAGAWIRARLRQAAMEA